MTSQAATTEQIQGMGDVEFNAYIAEVAARERATGLANVGRCDRRRWCSCGDTSGEESYYETADHRHGWFHDPAMGGCGAVTQTG